MALQTRVASLVLALGCALALPALAEETAAAIAKPNCKKPEYPGRLASDTQKKVFSRDVQAFGDCVKKFTTEQQRIADEHIKAANAAIAEYNAAVKEVQGEIDAATK